MELDESDNEIAVFSVGKLSNETKTTRRIRDNCKRSQARTQAVLFSVHYSLAEQKACHHAPMKQPFRNLAHFSSTTFQHKTVDSCGASSRATPCFLVP